MEPLNLPILLDASDLAFKRRLMVSPTAACAWADQVLGVGAPRDQAIACQIALSSNHAWSESERQAASNVRLKAWGQSPWPDQVEAWLPLVWEFEAHVVPHASDWVAGEWSTSMNRAQSYGVNAERVERLGLLASKSPMMKAWLAKLTPDQVLHQFDEAAGVGRASRATGSWQSKIAGRLKPADAAQKVIECWTLTSKERRLTHLDPAAAQIVASIAFSDPRSAFKAMRGVLMSPSQSGRGSMLADPMEGVLRHLALNPAPGMESDWERGVDPLPKLYGTSKAALSVAFELMCQLRIGAGLEALRWALALGVAPGQLPSTELTDGVDLKRFSVEVPLFIIDYGFQFKSLNIRILSMAEPALLMGDRAGCHALQKMGWDWPSKGRAQDMHDELKMLLRLAAGHPLRHAASGTVVDDNFPASFMAFWESIDLSQALPVPPQSFGPAPRPRI